MTFSLCAYIKNESSIIEEEVVVHKKIPNFDYSIEGLEPLTMVELTGEQVVYHGQNRINLLSVINTKIHHSELQKILEERLTPVEFKSKFFGNFTLDRRVNWFETKTRWMDTEIVLFLSGDLNEVSELESQAVQLFERQTEWDLRFRNKITEDLLALKNECWIDENENPLTEQEFQEKISLESLIIHKNGDFEAWYNDGDTFWGHAISVDGNLDGQLNEAGIHG